MLYSKHLFYLFNHLWKSLPCIWLLTTFGYNVNAQDNVSVNLSTGTANVNIPVYTMSRGQAAVPISLEYVATGIHVGELQGLVGTGWQLNAGGAIVRELHDLPDDIKSDQSNNSRMGWLYNTNATKINNFTITNDNNSATCTDETSDINYINNNFSDNSDMEPDVFYVQAPGLSCELVYDQLNSTFRTIPYQDIKISYTLNGTGNTITAFTIVNDKGIEYTFDVAESVTITTSSSAPSGVIYFKRPYNLFQYGIVYNSKWCLSKIKDPYGNAVVLTYTNSLTTRSFSTPTTIQTYNGSNWFNTTLYNTIQTYAPQFISSIYAYNTTESWSGESVSFNYTATTDDSKYIVSSISLNAAGRTLVCSYNKVPGYTRDYLVSFGESGCSSGGATYNSLLYKFDYTGITFASGSIGVPNLILNGDNQDYWGYPNENFDVLGTFMYLYPDNANYPNLERYRINPIPNYSGTYYTLSTLNKAVDVSLISLGTLNKITYPAGGSTSLMYEPNDYYDVSAATTYQGSGIRIKQLIDYDGLNTANNVVRNYGYTDAAGASTGKPVGLPACAFTIPYTGSATGAEYWKYSTVLLRNNYSANDLTVLYGKVTVQQTGAGKIVYEYANPATFWDASAGTDWTPTVVNTGRSGSGSCPSVGSLANSKYSYPFVPNINYDFERALLSKVSNFNESGNLVSQSTYSYQRSYANATPITALKFDDNGSAKAYAKYQIYTSTSELTSSEIKTDYDLSNTTADATKQIQSTTNYYYQSTSHKLPTKIEQINTDGTTDFTYTKYTKDYAFTSAADQTAAAIKALSDLNANYPVERYSGIKRNSVEAVKSAKLVKYGAFPSGLTSPANIYLPAQELKLLMPDNTDWDGFGPSGNSGGYFNYFSGYKPTANFLAYNYNGAVLSADDNYKNVNSRLLNQQLLPVAAISGAMYNEVVYSNFDGIDAANAFTQTNSTFINSVSRTGISSLSFPTSGLLQASPAIQPNAKNYMFSCWINSVAAGTLTISLYNSGGNLYTTKTISFVSNSSGWNYYEQKISTSGLTGTATIKVQTNTAVNIDDVLFYPENASVNTYAYEPKFFHKTAETNPNGISSYYSYDGQGRLQYVYDQDKNIVKKMSYATANSLASGLLSASYTISPNSGIKAGTSISFAGFSGSGSCTPGTYYSWDFGDGTTTQPSTTSTASHAYTYGGNYTAVLTVANAVYGIKTYSQVISVYVTPQACQSGVWAYASPTVYTTTCSGYPSDNTHSYFQVYNTQGANPGHTYSYQWQIAYTATGSNCGSGSWTNIGTNSNQLIQSFSTSTFCPYKVQCVITDNNTGQQVTTGIFYVSNSGLD